MLRFGARYDSRVVTGMLQSAVEFRLVFLPPERGITLDRPPDQTSAVPPVIQDNALVKGLPPGGDRDDVVLVEFSRGTFGPM